MASISVPFRSIFQSLKYGNCALHSEKYARWTPNTSGTVLKSNSSTLWPWESAYAFSELMPSGTHTGSQKCGTIKSTLAMGVIHHRITMQDRHQWAANLTRHGLFLSVRRSK